VVLAGIMLLLGVGFAVVCAVPLARAAAASAADAVVPGALAASATAVPAGGPAVFGPRADSYLAQSLGITVDHLEAARAEARQEALQQAVKDGTITQAQADALLKQGNRPAILGFGPGLATGLGTFSAAPGAPPVP
jgi:hypothetical protein